MADDPFLNKRLGGCRILQKLGEGGMGFAYKAHHDRLDRPVVLKILRPELARDKSFLDGFLREARAAAKLEHRRIVQVYDQGSEGGWNFIVMQYIEGETLADRIKAKGRLTALEAVPIIKAVFEGLAEAHARGIVHRDIKPSNIMLAKDGGVRLADFGLAAPLGGGEGGAVSGTPDYMPPEQAWGNAVDARADLYTMGGTLYHMLTGEPPYRGKTAADVISQHREAPIPDLRDHVPEIGNQAAEIVLKLMAKDPAERYASVEDVLLDLNSPGVVLGDASMLGEMEIDLGESVKTTQPMPRRIPRHTTPMPRAAGLDLEAARPKPASAAAAASMLPLAAASGLALAAAALAFVGGHSGNMIAAAAAAGCAAGAWRFAPHQAGIAAMALIAVGVGLLHGAGLLAEKTALSVLAAGPGAGAAPWLVGGVLCGWGAFALALDDKKSGGDRVLLFVMLAASIISWHWFALPGGSSFLTLADADARWPGALAVFGLSVGAAALVHAVSLGVAESLSDILFPLFLILSGAAFAFLAGALHHTPAADPPTIGVVLFRPFVLVWRRLGDGDGLAVAGLFFVLAGLGPMWYRVLVKSK